MSTTHDRATLAVNDVHVRYGAKRVLTGFSARFSPGVSVVLGPNGAGKSTLLRAISGQAPIHSGTVLLEEKDVTNNPDALVTRLGMTPQDVRLYDTLTPSETLSFVASLRGMTRPEAESEVEHLLAALDLIEHRTTLTRDLSGGTRRKLGVATALLGSPSLILLDESFAGLDPAAVRSLENELSQRASDDGCCILLVTHRLEVAARIAQQVVFLDSGALAQSWTRPEFNDLIDRHDGDAVGAYLDVLKTTRRTTG